MTRQALPRRVRARTVQAAIAMAALGVLFGIIGPFGSYLTGGIAERALYWTGSMWLGLLLFGGALELTIGRSPSWTGRTVAKAALVIALMSIPHAIVTHFTAFWLWPELARVGPTPLGWYGQTLVIALPVGLGYAWTGRAASAANTKDNPPDGQDLLGRLPASLGRDVLCLAMEDHYVRVHTPSGSNLVLMPLAQAITSPGLRDGLRTHRSWWVARHAIVRIEQDSRSVKLHLSNGVIAPVSRQAVATLRAQGWLSGMTE